MLIKTLPSNILNKKIKILYASDGLGNGGKERQLIETIKNLDRNLFEIGLITFNSNQYYSKLSKQISDYFIVFKKDKSVFEPFISVFEAFERFKPDIVHSYDLLSSLYTFLPSKIYNSKIVNASIQDTYLDKGWHKKFKKLLLSFSDKNISNSVKGLSCYNTNGEVLYNFIDRNRFNGTRNNEKVNVAMVANFTDYKDYSTYFKVAKRLIQLNLIDKAYAVGSGKYLSKYKSEMASENEFFESIVFTGNIENVESFLNDISVGFLFSTEEYGEGISNSVLEYMASGVIPIVSDIGASNEIIDNGVDGFLVDKYDVSGIVEILRRLRNDEHSRLNIIENAKKKISHKFDIMKNIRKLENIYTKLYRN